MIDTLPVLDGRSSIAVAGGYIWVGSDSGGEIVGIDPVVNLVRYHVPFSGTLAMTIGQDAMLYACSATQTVGINPDHNVAAAFVTFPYGCQSGITVADGTFWLLQDTQVIRLYPDGRLFSTIPIGSSGSGIAAGVGSMWVADGKRDGPGVITRIDLSTSQVVATIPVPVATREIIATASAVWVTTIATATDPTSLIRIDPATNTIVQHYDEGSGGVGIEFVNNHLWVVGPTGTVFVVDPVTNTVVDRPDLIPTGIDTGGDHLVSANGSVWITAQHPGTVIRVDPGSFGAAGDPGAATKVRVEVATGCPTSITEVVFRGGMSQNKGTNPDPTGLADSFVPGVPTSAVICRYNSLEDRISSIGSFAILGGSLFSKTVLGAGSAARLAGTANAITHSDIVAGCVPSDDQPRYTAIAFKVPGRSDVDIWLKQYYDCPVLTNGSRDSGELINGHGDSFLTTLDALANEAPQTFYSG